MREWLGDAVGGAAAFTRSFARNRLAVSGAAILGLFVVGAILAHWIAPFNPNEQFANDALQPPSFRYLFGTDDIGRDILSRVIFGGRVSLFVGLAAMTVSAVVGIPLGLLSGYYRGFIDTVIMRAMDTLLAFPAVLLAIFIVAVLGPSLINAIIAVGIIYIPAFARLTRANVLSMREREFVLAARCMGASDLRVLFRNVFPNCLSPLLVQFSLGIGYAMLVEAGLSFLGLGVQPPTPDWGQMVGLARNYITIAWWMITFPGFAIFLAVLAFNFVGDGLREATDPRLRAARVSRRKPMRRLSPEDKNDERTRLPAKSVR